MEKIDFKITFDVPVESLKIKKSSNFDDDAALENKFNLFRKKYTSCTPSLYVLNNAVYSPLKNRGKLIKNSEGAPIHCQVNNIYDDFTNVNNEMLVSENITYINDTVIDITSSGSALFSFWLLESLPKLKLIEDVFGFEFLKSCKILVNEKTGFVIDNLLALGIKSDQVMRRNGLLSNLNCQKLIAVTQIREHRYTPRWAFTYIQDLFSNYYCQVASYKQLCLHKASKRIYISRQKSHGRKVINSIDFEKMLGDYGFEIIFAEEVSNKEIIELMSNAEVVVSPHGAGLTNIVFCRPQTIIIELYSVHYTTQYRMICESSNLEYIPFSCSNPKGYTINSEEISKLSVTDLNRQDINVSLSKFRDLMDSIEVLNA